ncbi:MAG: hypothetical protein H0T46_12685 [Deltaproteobacteria bacterium]|nr:hypothetical protein [Deltaproteobacteria bacterium]
MTQNLDFEMAYPTAIGWRFVFTRLTKPLPVTGPIPVEVIETAEAAPTRSLGVLQLAAPFAARLDADPTKGWVSDVIDTTASGLVQRGPFRYTVDASKLVAPSPGPPGHEAEYGYEYDYELRPGVLVPIPRPMIGGDLVRIGGRWIRHDQKRETALVDAATGAQGPPIANVFWIEPGFKILPATDGGMWIMGSLGGAYLHVDTSFARTDHLTMSERLARLRVFDRAKRNSDFYLTGRRRVAVPVVLLWFPAFVVPMLLYGLAVRRSERWGPPARVALLLTALGYLLVRLIFYGPYNDLIGRFYS